MNMIIETVKEQPSPLDRNIRAWNIVLLSWSILRQNKVWGFTQLDVRIYPYWEQL